MKRHKTKYPGVFYREAQRLGGPGTERVYYVVYKKDGRVVEEKAGRQYADAMTPAKAARYRADRIEGRRPSRQELRQAEDDRWTIDRLWKAYMVTNRHLKSLGNDNNRYKRHLRPTFGHLEPAEIAPLDVDRLRLQLSKKLSPATVRHVLELLRRIINFGVKKDLCPPVSLKIQMPRVDNQRTEFLTPGEMRRLLEALDRDPNQKVASVARLALFTGMRKGEILRLRWDDIDFSRGFIRLREPKGGRAAEIPMGVQARRVLESLPRSEGSPWVFPGRDPKKPMKGCGRAIKRIRREAGLPDNFRPLHGLRHAFASALASSGQVDLFTIQKLLTHKSPLMTQRYAHLRDEALKRAASVADGVVEEALADGEKQTQKSG